MSRSPWTVEWFGTTTFRVRRPGLELFFDGYLDRLPGLDPVGLSVAEVNRADFVFVSHAHFDHLYGVAPSPARPAPPWSPPRRAPASCAGTASRTSSC